MSPIPPLACRAWRFVSILCILLVTACAGQTGKRAAQGAATGAAAGAVGGVVSALIFGGDVGDAAARGAAWGAGTGAVSGAVAGSREDNAAKKRQQDAAADKLRAAIGEDAYAGLTALVKCKHPVATGYARTAQKLDKREFALAGLWLEILTNADQGSNGDNRELLPAVVASDPGVSSEAEAGKKVEKALQGLENIRRDHKLAVKCPR